MNEAIPLDLHRPAIPDGNKELIAYGCRVGSVHQAQIVQTKGCSEVYQAKWWVSIKKPEGVGTMIARGGGASV
jgi:hypothetical protein